MTPNAIFELRADAEGQNEQRQDRDLRQAIDQEHDRHQAPPRERLQPDGEPDDEAEDNRNEKRDGQFEEREPQRRRDAGRAQHAAELCEDTRRWSDEQRIHEPARGYLPSDHNENDDAEPDNSGMPQKEAPPRRQSPPVPAQTGLQRWA